MKPVSIILLVLIAISISAGTLFADDVQDFMTRGHRSPKWTPLVKEGLQAFENDDLDMAANFFKRAMEKGCKDGLVYFKLGLYNEYKGKPLRAKEYFQLAKKHLPKRYPRTEPTKTVNEHLGRVLMSLGDIPGAKGEFTSGLTKYGPNFSLLFLLGSIARQEGDTGRVIEYYTKALKYPPPDGTNPQEILITVLIEIGKAHYDRGEYDKSSAIWQQVLARMPDHPIARQYMTSIQRSQTTNTMKDEEQRIIEQIIR